MENVSEELDRLAHMVIGAAIAVHRESGPGFLESVYEQALAVELDCLKIRFSRQVPISISYRDEQVGEGRLDLLIESSLIVELKAVDALNALHQAQVISYLKATGKPLGLLVNFNVPILRDGIKRAILTKRSP